MIGVDATEWSMRNLCWAAWERRRMLGELTAYQIAWIARLMPFANIELDPDQINPYRETAGHGIAPQTGIEAKMRELEAWQARAAWRFRVEEAQRKKGK